MPPRVPLPTTTTIAAIASPPGGGLRGIVRLSGPASAALARAVLASRPRLPATRTALRDRFDDGAGTQPVLALWMPGPRSYTREDVLELHLPGAEPLLARALARLLELGATAAQPGEFTRRAFLNGRLDLTRAEAVLELVEATNEAERRAATRLLAGGLAERVAALRDALDDVRALAEASLDFDESETGHVPTEELLARVDAAARALDDALGWEVARQPPSALPRVVLVGAPNAGKSSLWNALSGERALVSERAGTTRDGLAGLWRLSADACAALVDLPGVSDGAVGAERTAQELAARERAGADLLLWVVDARRGAAELRAEEGRFADLPRHLVWNQVDRAGVPPAPPAVLGTAEGAWSACSARTGAGLAALADAVAARLGLTAEPSAAAPPAGRELFARHRSALESARAALGEARAALAAGAPLDLVAQALREATGPLDAIAGRSSPEDLLDRIFARFCLGK